MLKEEIKQRIVHELKDGIKSLVHVVNVQRLAHGANSLCFKLETQHDKLPEIRFYCLRLEDRESKQEKFCSMKMEAEILLRLYESDVAVPRLVVSIDEEKLGVGHVTDWLNGETGGRQVVAIGRKIKDQRLMSTQCGRVLADIHTFDYQKLLSQETLSKLPEIGLESYIKKTWSKFNTMNLIRPSTEFIFRWCLDQVKRLKSKESLCLVHGDFRNGNLVATKNGIVGVLDWELCHIGSPYLDLAYLCINSWRFGNDGKAVGGFGSKEDLLESYLSNIRRRRGKLFSFDPERLRTWSIVCSLHFSILCQVNGSSWVESMTSGSKSLTAERAVWARRSTEAECDCIRKIFEINFNEMKEPFRLFIPEIAEFNPFIYNSLEEEIEEENDISFVSTNALLSSVQQFLEYSFNKNEKNDIHHFLSRISKQALQIAKRELLYRQRLDEWEKRRLVSLLDIENDVLSCNEMRRKLSKEIGKQELSNQEFFLAGYHLLLTLLGQMQIDQPYYAALRRAKSKARLIFSGRLHCRL